MFISLRASSPKPHLVSAVCTESHLLILCLPILAYPASYPMGSGGSFPGGKAAEA